MEKKTIQKLIVVFILFAYAMYWGFYWATGGQGTDRGMGIVPLNGMTMSQHLLILNLWVLIGSIIMILTMSLVLLPFFLTIKRIIWRKYTEAYIEVKEDFNGKKFAKRSVYIFLLTMGLSATLGVFINWNLFISPDVKAHFSSLGFTVEYMPHAYVGLQMILYPFVIGIWSVGWALEDMGLMHYKLPDEKKQVLYEIEPIHLKYNGIIKGYAGISAIIYFISMITFYNSLQITGEYQYSEGINLSITLTFMFIPAYLIYLKLWLPVLKKIYRRGKRQIPIITKREFEDKTKS